MDLIISKEKPKSYLQKDICNTMLELQKTGQLCDAVINVEDECILVHRIIMAASSPYFRVLFTNERFTTDRQVVDITDYPAAIIHDIIDYMYTHVCRINDKNVRDLLIAADYFNMTDLETLCCTYLASKISPTTCIEIKNFAQKYFCKELEHIAYNYFLHNFHKVFKVSNDFLNLGVDDLCHIFSSDELNIKSEEIAFQAIIHWIDHDPLIRKWWVAKLLRTVRLGLLSTNYFVIKVKSHPYVRECEGCKAIVVETLKLLYDLDINEDHETDISNPIARPRVPYEIIFILGGWSGRHSTNFMETYDFRANRWLKCKNVRSDFRAYHGSCVLDQHIYIIGGFDGMEYFNTVRCFDPISQTWSEAGQCTINVLGNEIYALGGFDGTIRQKTAERYNKNNNQWTYINPMNIARSDACATSLRERIYICGGFDGIEIFSSAEYFLPSVNQWTMITPMRNLRSGVSVVAHQDFVYALGGFNGVTRMNSVERYSPDSNTWHSMQEMDIPRSNFATVVLEDTIFAIGGFDDLTTIASVERYDNSMDQWYKVNDMNIHRSALSACVVKGLPNVKNYIYERFVQGYHWKWS